MEKIKKLIEPIISDLNLKLISIELVVRDNDKTLEVIIDSDKGIDIDDCVKVTQAINPILDEQDIIDSAYTLEVMSKGVENE